jgi:hypothetical protein
VGADLGKALGTDYFHLREELSAAEADYLERARRFVEDEVLAVIGDYWERAELPWDLVRRLGELGLVRTLCARSRCWARRSRSNAGYPRWRGWRSSAHSP